jgi:hypothetical protein
MFDDSEERQLTQVVADLAAEFPDVPPEVITGLSRRAIERYEAAKVRTFVPILVTKDVRALLRAGGHRPGVPRQTSPARDEAIVELVAGRPA